MLSERSEVSRPYAELTGDGKKRITDFRPCFSSYPSSGLRSPFSILLSPFSILLCFRPPVSSLLSPFFIISLCQKKAAPWPHRVRQARRRAKAKILCSASYDFLDLDM